MGVGVGVGEGEGEGTGTEVGASEGGCPALSSGSWTEEVETSGVWAGSWLPPSPRAPVSLSTSTTITTAKIQMTAMSTPRRGPLERPPPGGGAWRVGCRGG